MPGCVIAAARHNRPTIIVYGGTIQPGVRNVDCPALGYKKGDDMTAVDAFESYGIQTSPRARQTRKLIFVCRCIYRWEDNGRGAIRCRSSFVSWSRCMWWDVHVCTYIYVSFKSWVILRSFTVPTQCPVP